MSASAVRCPDPATHLAGLAAAEREVLAVVAAYHDVTARTLVGRTRTQAVRDARWVAMALLARGGWSHAAIGRILLRDHSTVLYGLARLDAHAQATVEHLAAALALGSPAGMGRLGQERAIRQGAAGLPAGDDLAQYLLSCVLGWRRPDAGRTRRALLLLSAHPWLLRSCTRLLAQAGLAPFGTILQHQVAALAPPGGGPR